MPLCVCVCACVRASERVCVCVFVGVFVSRASIVLCCVVLCVGHGRDLNRPVPPRLPIHVLGSKNLFW